MLSAAPLARSRPGLLLFAALLLLDGALTLGSDAEARPRPPAEERADERSEARAEAPAEAQPEPVAVRTIVPVLTEREKRCRQLHQCEMSGPCPPCPR